MTKRGNRIRSKVSFVKNVFEVDEVELMSKLLYIGDETFETPRNRIWSKNTIDNKFGITFDLNIFNSSLKGSEQTRDKALVIDRNT